MERPGEASERPGDELERPRDFGCLSCLVEESVRAAVGAFFQSLVGCFASRSRPAGAEDVGPGEAKKRVPSTLSS